MPSERLNVLLTLTASQYKKEAREASSATNEIGKAATGAGSAIGRFLGPAAIGGAIVGLGKMAYEVGQNADRLFDLESQTGLTTDQLQEFEFVAKAAGASQEVFSDAVKAVIKNLSESEGATGAAGKAYETLGISVFDASGKLRDAGSITEEVFSKLAGMSNITERNALAQDLFGKKWEETISVLDLGSEAIDGLRGEARQLGVVMSGDALRKADKFRETMDKLKASAEAAANKGLAVFLPLLIDIVEELESSAGLLADSTTFFDELGRAISGSSEDASEAKKSYDDAHGALAFLGFGLEDTLKLFGFLGGAMRDSRLASEALTTATVLQDEAMMNSAQRAMEAVPSYVALVGMIDRGTTSFSNAAKAADTQRRALINLANAQADLLDPLGNVLRLQRESKEAAERLATAQADEATSASDLALAVIEAEQAELRLQSAGAALTADQIQAFAQILITDLGMSERQALDTLDALNLLDGWTGSATFTLNTISNLEKAIGGALSNTAIQVRQHGGPVWAGRPYLVGERGPEMMIPRQSGSIISHQQLAGMSRPNVTGPTIVVQSPMKDFRTDLQYATILASVTNLVESQ